MAVAVVGIMMTARPPVVVAVVVVSGEVERDRARARGVVESTATRRATGDDAAHGRRHTDALLERIDFINDFKSVVRLRSASCVSSGELHCQITLFKLTRRHPCQQYATSETVPALG